MVRVEVTFSNGALRQPGIWAKIVPPGSNDVYDVPMEPGVQVKMRDRTRTITLPDYPEGAIMVFGVKGYHQAGVLVACYVLMRVQAGAFFDWQFPGHLARFEGKGVELLARAENDLTPIYAAVEQAKFPVERLRDHLRRQGIDRQAGNAS